MEQIKLGEALKTLYFKELHKPGSEKFNWQLLAENLLKEAGTLDSLQSGKLNLALAQLAPKGSWFRTVLENIWCAEKIKDAYIVASEAAPLLEKLGLWSEHYETALADDVEQLRQKLEKLMAEKSVLSGQLALAYSNMHECEEEARQMGIEEGRRQALCEALSENGPHTGVVEVSVGVPSLDDGENCLWTIRDNGLGYSTSCGCIASPNSGIYCQHCGRKRRELRPSEI